MHGRPVDRSRAGLAPRGWPRHILVSGGGALLLLAVIGAGAYVAGLPLGRAGPSSLGGGSPAAQLPGVVEALGVGLRAPEFTTADGRTPLLLDLAGQPIHLADFAGRPIWIVFWATWCAPCQQEAPRILDASRAHDADRLVVLAIDLQEPGAAVAAYASAHGLDYRIGLDPTATVRDLYRSPALPSHVFIDANGIVRARYAGEMTRALMDRYLATITGA